MAEKCTYSTIFSVSGGQIMVSIISPYMLLFGNLPRVILIYEDKINKLANVAASVRGTPRSNASLIGYSIATSTCFNYVFKHYPRTRG